MVVALPTTDLGSTVFVVDADLSVREAVRSLLRSAGLHAEAFASAEEFMQATRPEVPSCLVLEVKLPGISGLDLQDRLRDAGIQIPVVFIAAHNDVAASLRALKGGAVEFLAKPFQTQELLTAIYQALETDRARREGQAGFSAFQSRIDQLTSREREVAVDMALLNKLANRLSVSDPLHEVLSEVVEFIAAVVECDSCMIYILEGKDLVLRASRNPHPEVTGRLKMGVGEGITGWVAMHWKPVVVAQGAHSDPRFKLFNELPEDRFEAFLSVPLISGGRLVGVINLQDRAKRQYSKRDINVIATLGFLVGAEVERARLETENSELSEKLESRKLIDRAKGILQRDLKMSEEEAYRTMQRESQKRRKSMKDVSESILLNDDLKRGSR
ncbi:MAG TPA: response regulator [Candidatus Acidoferrales bacterium]|nr:response regulator [Candidatus Acidoferrales bacterium]